LNIEWKPLQIFDTDSAQSAKEFLKLSKFRSRDMSHEVADKMQQLDRQSYAEMLAPFDTNEDFSTCSMLRDKGNSLTTEKLVKLMPEQIIEQILIKAGVVNFARVFTILRDICALKKIAPPDEREIVRMLVAKSYVMVE
jgi:hypothetical protein